LGCEEDGAAGAEVDPAPVRALQVFGPTTPSTPMPAEDWLALTARRVAEPNTPSTFRFAPWAFRRSWR
jgi:hypothetical protein